MTDFAFDPPEEPHFTGMYGRPQVIPQRPSMAARKLREKGITKETKPESQREWPHPFRVALPKR